MHREWRCHTLQTGPPSYIDQWVTHTSSCTIEKWHGCHSSVKQSQNSLNIGIPYIFGSGNSNITSDFEIDQNIIKYSYMMTLVILVSNKVRIRWKLAPDLFLGRENQISRQILKLTKLHFEDLMDFVGSSLLPFFCIVSISISCVFLILLSSVPPNNTFYNVNFIRIISIQLEGRTIYYDNVLSVLSVSHW